MTVVLLSQISLCFIQLSRAQILNDRVPTITTTSATRLQQNVAPGDVVEDRQYWYSNTNNNFGGYNPQLSYNQFNPVNNWQGGYGGGGGGMAYQPQQQPQWNPWQQQQQMQPPNNQEASRFEASSYYYPQNQQQQLNRGVDNNQQGVTPPVVSSFEALHCGHSNPTPLQISRAKRSLTFRKRKSTPATTPTAPTTESSPSGNSASTFDNAEGAEERIVGGRVTNVNFWPWQISLRQGDMHFCGGSIIARHFIITAAHCFDNRSRNVNDWVVYAAKSKLRNGERGEIGPLHISSIIIHPDYGRVKPFDSDLAIIQLITPLNYSNTIYPICLPNNGNVAIVGSECFVTGFGKTMNTGGDKQLKVTRAPILSTYNCGFASRYEHLSTNMICAGFLEGGTGSCQGDSGGPLACRRKDVPYDDVYELQGVVSFGYECAARDQPSIYTAVANYIPWILRVMQTPIDHPRLLMPAQPLPVAGRAGDFKRYHIQDRVSNETVTEQPTNSSSIP